MPRQVAIAGAGIAGLAAALAFAARGWQVMVFERAATLEEIGAGLQLSPNATRLLRRLGLLEPILDVALRPEAVVLRDGSSMTQLARIPLGDAAENRWGAPYLVLHRAALQRVLLAQAERNPAIVIERGAAFLGATPYRNRLSLAIDLDRRGEIGCDLLVGADGVHSAVRALCQPSVQPGVSHETAWRAMLSLDSEGARFFAQDGALQVVSAFLGPGFHLIAYPMRSTGSINLVAFTKHDAGRTSDETLKRALATCAPSLRGLASLDWTAWPIHAVDRRQSWTSPSGIALVGDAAHAMTPYAAQGAAMAIEDAVTLADAVDAAPNDQPGALARWEQSRKPRIERVASRAELNRFAWHAAGPVALARNAVLKLRGGAKLAADLDWLYGWAPPA